MIFRNIPPVENDVSESTHAYFPFLASTCFNCLIGLRMHRAYVKIWQKLFGLTWLDFDDGTLQAMFSELCIFLFLQNNSWLQCNYFDEKGRLYMWLVAGG